jgi:protoheme IX farnesyltransferase
VAPEVRLGDFFSLTKPRITANVLLTTAAGIFLAPGHLGPARLVAALLGTALVVGGANTLNCYVEREIDARMLRTRGRALAAGRIEPRDGLMLGLILAMLSIPLLSLALNPLTGLLALIALISYVAVYTPLKRVTPKALLVGAVPGAIPPLLGWTAVTGSFELGGLLLFALMFTWQIPHFLAITLYLKDDYARGGHRVMPLVRGEGAARLHLLLWTLVLVPVSLSFTFFHLAGPIYAAVALVLDGGFIFFAVRALRIRTGPSAVRSARAVFAYSLLYLILLFPLLVADRRSPPSQPGAPAAITSASTPRAR